MNNRTIKNMKLTEVKSWIFNKCKKNSAAIKKITLGQWIIIALLLLILWQLIDAPIFRMHFIKRSYIFEKNKGECILNYGSQTCSVSFYTRPSIFIVITKHEGDVIFAKSINFLGKSVFKDGTAYCLTIPKPNFVTGCRYNGIIYKFVDVNEEK
ncbi:MAG: hypothetical protein WA052_02380 [Microgenomates group bacterium]